MGVVGYRRCGSVFPRGCHRRNSPANAATRPRMGLGSIAREPPGGVAQARAWGPPPRMGALPPCALPGRPLRGPPGAAVPRPRRGTDGLIHFE
jgi:hypothetical protein